MAEYLEKNEEAAKNWNNADHTNDENFYKFVAVVADKKEVKFKEDILGFILCNYIEENVKKYKISPRQRAKYLAQAILVQFLVLFMLIAQHYAWFTNENHEYHDVPDHSLMLALIKVPCIIALHFVLTPEVDSALKIMKFANQESHQFV
jgi:hypothetical protein